MKTLGKAIAAASLAAISVNAAAVEGLSTTIGAVSDYYFRGANLGNAGAYASVDYEVAGFYAGVWAIDDGGQAGGPNGLETDWYLGYGVDLDGIELGIGYTRYEYTYIGDFEHEINLSLAVAGFGVDVALGNNDDENVGGAGDDADYTVVELSYGSGPYGIKLGFADQDAGDVTIAESEYKWVEVSYSAEVATMDVTATLGHTFDMESTAVGSTVTMEPSSGGSNYLVFDVSKGFDL